MTNFNAPLFKTFAENVRFKTASRILTLKTVVETQSNIEHLADVKIDNQTLILNVMDEDADKKGIERRQTVTVRGKDYTIVEVGNDLNGLTQFKVSRL